MSYRKTLSAGLLIAFAPGLADPKFIAGPAMAGVGVRPGVGAGAPGAGVRPGLGVGDRKSVV